MGRIWVHIGVPKSGTSYLQGVIWANRERLRDAGLLLPLSGVEAHYRLSNAGPVVAHGRRAATRSAGAAAWKAMAAEVAAWRGDALISHELFSHARRARVEWMLSELARLGEVRVVITARDLARQIPAGWQQSVKQGRAHRLEAYYELVRDDDPGIVFWRGQDVPALVSRWTGASGLRPPVHVVTVPPAGAPSDELWRRFAGAVGIGEPSGYDLSTARRNESLGWCEIELIRRVNEASGRDSAATGVRDTLVPLLEGRGTASRPGTPPEHAAWVAARAAGMRRRLAALDLHVEGDLDDLLPARHSVAEAPDEPGEALLLEGAVEALAALIVARRGGVH